MSRFCPVGDQGQQKLLEQGRITGNQQGGQPALEAELYSGLPKQKGGLLRQPAAQAYQIQRDGAEERPLRAVHPPHEIQIGQQAVHSEKAPVEGAVMLLPGSALKFQKDLLKKTTHLTDEAVQLPVCQAGLGGGPHQQQTARCSSHPAEQVQNALVGEGARPVRILQGRGEKAGKFHPGSQLRKTVHGNTVQPLHLSMHNLYGTVRKLLQIGGLIGVRHSPSCGRVPLRSI